MKVVNTIYGKIRKHIQKLKLDEATKNYIKHNKFNFLYKSSTVSSPNVILFEFNEYHSSHIAYSYLAQVLSNKHDAKIVAYLPVLSTTWGTKITEYIFPLMYPLGYNIYRSFGMQEFITPKLNRKQLKKSKSIFATVIAGLSSKSDIENITINKVWIGDLIYDSYLKISRKPTIDMKSKDFHETLSHSINLFVYWEDYFSNHNVKAICVSHCVYTLAIPLRIAIKNNIPAYQANISHLYRLSKEHPFAYSDFKYFNMRFLQLPLAIQTAGLKEAERRLQRRLSGEVGVDMKYSTKSAYGVFKQHRLIKDTQKIKVLIATHCFFDSPHSYGLNLFPDFYEWIDYLGKISERTEYDWYIKTHPDYLLGTKEVIDSFIKKYPKFNLLPADSSHHQIIEEGIDFALTVYGTIGVEYAALDIPVINASLNNPHISYNFNLHPKNIEEYEKLLMHLEDIEITIDKKQINEFYFMKNIYNTNNWLINNHDEMIDRIGGYNEQFTTKIYKLWLDEYTVSKHEKILLFLSKYIESNDFRLNHNHMDEEFRIETIRN